MVLFILVKLVGAFVARKLLELTLASFKNSNFQTVEILLSLL